MVKNPPAMQNVWVVIPGLGRSPGGGKDYPLQDSGLENPMDRGAWWATVHAAAKSQTQLSDFHFTSRASGFHLVSLFPTSLFFIFLLRNTTITSPY